MNHLSCILHSVVVLKVLCILMWNYFQWSSTSQTFTRILMLWGSIMVPAWLTVTWGSRVPGLKFSLAKLLLATCPLPLSSLLHPLFSGSAQTMGFSGAPVTAKGSLLCLPGPARGCWHPLETCVWLAGGEDATGPFLSPVHPGLCALALPSAPSAFCSCPCGCCRLSFRL